MNLVKTSIFCALLVSISGCGLIFPTTERHGLFPATDKWDETDELVIDHLKKEGFWFERSNQLEDIIYPVLDYIEDAYDDRDADSVFNGVKYNIWLTSGDRAYIAVLPGGSMLISEPMVNDSTGVSPNEMALIARHAVLHHAEQHYLERLRGKLIAKYGGMRHRQALKSMGYLYSIDILLASGAYLPKQYEVYSRGHEKQVAKVEVEIFGNLNLGRANNVTWRTINPSVPSMEQYLRMHPHKQLRLDS